MTLTLHGELDVATREHLIQATTLFAHRCITDRDSTAQHACGAPTTPPATPTRAAKAIIDTSDVAFIDAAALGVLISLHTTLSQAGIPVQVRRPSPALTRISTICGLDSVLGLQASATNPSGRHNHERDNHRNGADS